MFRGAPLWAWISGGLLSLYCLSAFSAVAWHNAGVLAGQDRLAISGGGFIFNYRIASIAAGVSVSVQKPVPDDWQVEASLRYPGGKTVDMKPGISTQRRTLVFETDSLIGIEADTAYVATVRLSDPSSGETVETHEKVLHSGVVPRHAPGKALTIGPGYHPNPDR